MLPLMMLSVWIIVGILLISDDVVLRDSYSASARLIVSPSRRAISTIALDESSSHWRSPQGIGSIRLSDFAANRQSRENGSLVLTDGAILILQRHGKSIENLISGSPLPRHLPGKGKKSTRPEAGCKRGFFQTLLQYSKWLSWSDANW